MFTRFSLRPSSSPLLLPPSPPFSTRRLTLISTRRLTVAVNSSSVAVNQTLTYGPSLSKGHNPSPTPNSPHLEPQSFDETSFTRVFDVSALRVTADRCFALENQLRGHLLNWPRIRNIARVPGDEIDPTLQKYFDSNNEQSLGTLDTLVTLDRRIDGKAEGDGERLSPVLYRDKLVKSFDSRGYEKFRNLAKLSRPKRKTKKESRGVDKEDKRNECYLIEEVFDDDDDENVGDLSGLIGEDGFRLGKWKGSTRLLLLDERFVDKSIDELPEAIKACLMGSVFELVRCRLTLYYIYWQMNEVLEALLPKGMIVPSSFETVGQVMRSLGIWPSYEKFRNLAKLSRPKRKMKTESREVSKEDKWNERYLIEEVLKIDNVKF